TASMSADCAASAADPTMLPTFTTAVPMRVENKKKLETVAMDQTKSPCMIPTETLGMFARRAATKAPENTETSETNIIHNAPDQVSAVKEIPSCGSTAPIPIVVPSNINANCTAVPTNAPANAAPQDTRLDTT